MARFGRIPIEVPDSVKVKIDSSMISVTGPKGTLAKKLPREVIIEKQADKLLVTKKVESRIAQALQGTFRAHIINMIKGVTEGWKKELEIVGAGYKAEVRGNELVLNVGYSHPVTIKAPEGVLFEVQKNFVSVYGADTELVGQIAAKIRSVRKPEPYKGMGIRYKDEVVRRKAGKQAAKTGE